MYRHKVCALAAIGQHLLDRGVVPADFLGSLGLPPSALLAGELWIHRDQSLLLASRLALTTGDPLAGMHVAEIQHLENYGLWSAKVLASKTLGDALRMAIHDIRLIETGRGLELLPEGDHVRLRTWFAGAVGADPRQYLEASLVLLCRIIRLAAEPVRLQVHLPGKRPRRSDEIERLVGPDLVFGADRAALVFDRRALELPIVKREDSFSFSWQKRIPVTPAETAAAVMHWLDATTEYDRPTAANVAESLSLNLRTMQRHLGAWGVTYEELLHDLRLRKALIRLRDPDHSITDVAFGLGYSDAAHFTRAFKRWTGGTPCQYRDGAVAVPQTITGLLTAASGTTTRPD